MGRKVLKIGGYILLAFLFAENRFLVFADRFDRLAILVAFSLIFIFADFANKRTSLYKKACEKQAERWSNAYKKNKTSTSSREYIDFDMR